MEKYCPRISFHIKSLHSFQRWPFRLDQIVQALNVVSRDALSSYSLTRLFSLRSQESFTIEPGRPCHLTVFDLNLVPAGCFVVMLKTERAPGHSSKFV